MTLEDLIAQFRIDSDDRVFPYFWDDAAVAVWLTEATAEAAIRGRLLHESFSPSICQVQVTVGATSYPLHEALHEIDHIAFMPIGASRRESVALLSREELDRIEPGWRDRSGQVKYAIQSDTTIRLAFAPESAGTLFIEGYRVPLNTLENDTDTPEIHPSHHSKLVLWALHRAFSVPDAETVDKDRAALAELEFSRYFGERPDADLRRSTTHDVPHRNQAFWV